MFYLFIGSSGYMSPEYVLQGLLSTKSDVFSFGVIVLEIMSGMKNATFYESDCSLNLLGHVSNNAYLALIVEFLCSCSLFYSTVKNLKLFVGLEFVDIWTMRGVVRSNIS